MRTYSQLVALAAVAAVVTTIDSADAQPKATVTQLSPLKVEVQPGKVVNVQVNGTHLAKATRVDIAGIPVGFFVRGPMLILNVTAGYPSGPVTVTTPTGTATSTEQLTIVTTN